jgi:hypothetical protein
MSARQLVQAIQTAARSRWILAVAIVGAVLVYLTLALYVRGAAAPIAQVHSAPIAKATVPPSAESAHAAAGANTTPSPALPIAKFRFGYVEFESDPDASNE